MVRKWRAKCNCMMPWKDFSRGDVIELDDEAVTERVKALFECLTQDQEKKIEDEGKVDLDYNVMMSRLKQAKITIPKSPTKKVITELFMQTLGNGDLPNIA